MAKTAKQVMDIRASKGISKGESDEQQRRWGDKAWAEALRRGNHDRTREHLNFEIVKGGIVQPVDKSKRMTERMGEVLMKRGIKDPNEGLNEPKYRTCVNIIFGGSRERMRQLAFGNQVLNEEHGADNSHLKRLPEIEQWAKDMYEFACGKWGEENIIGFYVHLDELNPHLHCTLLPLDKDNKFAFKRLFAGENIYDFKARTTALHNELAVVNERWGLGRGDNIAETGAKHRSTEEYRRMLTSECTTLEEKIENHKAVLDHLQADIRLAERRVKGLTTMVANLENHKYELEEELDNLRADLKAGRGDSEELRTRIHRLDSQLQKVLDNLADKKVKLNEADRKLEELKVEMEATRERTEELRKNAYHIADNIEQQTRYRMTDALYGEVADTLRTLWPTMTDEQKNLLSGTVLEDVAERSEKIIECGMLLLCGYIDHATDFAQGSGGGGGGSSDKDWGRRDDEDDMAWTRRMMRTARRMMRPSGGKSVKRK